ncbi:MAG: hypothetical protein ABR518_06325 [Actinomycetota bacterium]
MDFMEAAKRHGFAVEQDRPRRGVRTYAARPSRFLTYWLHAYDDGSALLTWEFAISDYLSERGMQIGSAESLNLFLFPVRDHRGPQDAAWLTHALDETDARLRAVNFAEPD